MARQNNVLSIVILFAAVISNAVSAHADFAPAVATIAPAATEITDQLPPVPARMRLFGWSGSAGSTYTVTFSGISSEPALVVAVGATLTGTSFDSGTDELTVTLDYDGETILANSDVDIPTGSFLLFLDPGVDPATLTGAQPSAERCYGPGADPSVYANDGSDFGDDDGLNDPSESNPDDTTVGYPTTAAGSYASTNTFFWCAVPPRNGLLTTGIRLSAASGATGRLQIHASSGLLTFLSDLIGDTVTAANAALFSDLVQGAINFSNDTDGTSISISAPIEDNSAVINTATSLLVATKKKRLKGKAHVLATATASSSLAKRSFTIGKRERLSLAPTTSAPTAAVQTVGVFGFVDDPTLEDTPVYVIRLGGSTRCSIAVNTIFGTVIGRGIINSAGKWGATLPKTAIFRNNAKKSKLVSVVAGDATRQSREVTLTNKSRNNRR